jgi:hypothetical protein
VLSLGGGLDTPFQRRHHAGRMRENKRQFAVARGASAGTHGANGFASAGRLTGGVRSGARACLLSALLISMVLGCRTGTRHPPTFSDFQRAFQRGSRSEAGIEAEVAVFSAAMLSEQEVKVILGGTNAEAMIGAALQGRLEGTVDMELLERATQVCPTNPVAWAALAYRSIDLLANRVVAPQTAGDEVGKSVEALRRLAPSNSVPFYLQAGFECLRTNVATAKDLTVQASRWEGFETYETPLKLCIVRALESAGYSKFSARIVASGNSAGVVCWSKLSKAVLAADPSDDEVRACLVLGARVGGGRSFLDQLVGDSIQRKAAEKLRGVEFGAEARRIAERKESIKRATRYLDSARTREVTETQWVEYYDRCFDSGEMEAIQALAREMGATF